MKNMKFYFTVDFPTDVFPEIEYEVDSEELDNCTVEEGLEILKKLVSTKKIDGKFRSMGKVEIKNNYVLLTYESCEVFSENSEWDDDWIEYQVRFPFRLI